MRGDRGEVLERLDGLLAPLGIARAQRRGEDLLQQRRTRARPRCGTRAGCGPRRRSGRARSPRARSRARSRRSSARRRAAARDDPVLLELGDQPRSAPVSSTTSSSEYSAPRSRSENEPPQRRARPARRRGRPAAGAAARRLGAAGGELLADHAQRQELVALQAQDRAQARDVGLRVEPVAAGRAPRRQQLLVLQVADLGDRDVRELLRQRLADRADGQRLRGARPGRPPAASAQASPADRVGDVRRSRPRQRAR